MEAMFSAAFERFAAQAPVTVMARAAVARALDPAALDALFEATAERQYTERLMFSAMADLMGLVVAGTRPSVRAAYQRLAPSLGASLAAVYEKLAHTEPALSAALVRHTGERLADAVDAMCGARPPLVPGYATRLIDGNHLAATERRLAQLRASHAGPLPGYALVVLDAERMLVREAIPSEDAYVNERAFTPRILELVRPGELWIADRNFCTTELLRGIAARAHFVIREHAASVRLSLRGERREVGRGEGSTIYEQAADVLDAEGEAVLRVRRVTVALEAPTRDGARELHILTNLPERDADAVVAAGAYRGRWTEEAMFGELDAALEGELDTLAYPRAALFGFCTALATWNVYATVKAALRGAHGAEKVEAEVSGYYVAVEVREVAGGLSIATEPEDWEAVRSMAVGEFALLLLRLARVVRLAAFKKSVRGPKKPPTKRTEFTNRPHVSTARVLNREPQRKRP